MTPWLKVARVTNVPTVLSNVLLAWATALVPAWHGLPAAAVTMVAGTCAYCGGMALNDAFDADFDRANGADRPVPLGEVSRKAVLVLALVLLAGSVALFVMGAHLADRPVLPAAAMAAGLVFAVVNYNAMHRRGAAVAALLMGLCRVMLVLTAAVVLAGAISWLVLIAAGAVGCWTGGITLIARGERGGEARALSGPWWLIIGGCMIVPANLLSGGDYGPMAGAALIVFIAWVPAVVRRARLDDSAGAVMWAIAGLGVLDMALLMSIGQLEIAALCLVLGVSCLAGARRLPGT